MDFLKTFYGTDWIGMVFGFLSTYQLGKHRKRGFLIGVVGNLSWIGFGVLSGSYASIVANVAYIAINTHCYRKWKRENEQKDCTPNATCVPANSTRPAHAG